MTADLHNAIKRTVAAQLGTLPMARRGTIVSVNPAKAQARVQIEPEGALSGWLPIATVNLGAGWGLLSLPVPGTQCVVLPIDGDAHAGVVIGYHYSGPQPPPTTAPGEMWLYHATGSTLSITANGAITAKDASGAFWQLPNNGTAVIQDKSGTSLTFQDNGSAALAGNLTVTGDITAGYGGADQIGVRTHTHTQAPDSHGDTEEPTSAPTAGT